MTVYHRTLPSLTSFVVPSLSSTAIPSPLPPRFLGRRFELDEGRPQLQRLLPRGWKRIIGHRIFHLPNDNLDRVGSTKEEDLLEETSQSGFLLDSSSAPT